MLFAALVRARRDRPQAGRRADRPRRGRAWRPRSAAQRAQTSRARRQGLRSSAALRLRSLVPRNRTVRLAVLGSSVQRAAASGYSSSRSSALKRRIVVGGLVLVSLVLITVSFRSSALDGVAGHGGDDPAAVRGGRRTGSRGRSATPPAGRTASSTRRPRTRSCAAQIDDAPAAADPRRGRRAGERPAEGRAELPRSGVDRELPPGHRGGARRTRRTRSTRASTIAAGSRDGVHVGNVVVTTAGPRRHDRRASPRASRG